MLLMPTQLDFTMSKDEFNKQKVEEVSAGDKEDNYGFSV